MKRTMRKELFRAVTKSVGRFLSIFLIVALGCGFFAGIKATGPDMKEAADKYYDTTELADLHLVSELGFSQDNVDKIAATSGIASVMPSYQAILTTMNQGESQKIRVQSISAGDDWAKLNQLTVKSGRLPESKNECVMDERAIKKQDYSIGQTITLKESTDTQSSILSEDKLTIVGTVDSPLYISFSWGASTLGNNAPDYNIFVLPDAFSSVIYTDIYVTTTGTKELASYSDDYTNRVNSVLTDIKSTGESASTARKDDVIAKKSQELKTAGATPEMLKAAAQKMGSITNKWYYLDRSYNEGYSEYNDDAARINAISSVFPFFFFAVAALVSLTTMTRMVDEERTQIGSLKALGYSRFSIAMKYTLYAAMASIAGGIAGLLIGFQLFPRVIYNAYLIMNKLPPIHPPFRMDLAWITLLAAVVCTSIAALFAILASLRSTPAMLLRPKAPKIGKRVLLERIPFIWKKLGFIEKVTARNIFRYKKRFFMTVIGIAGCTALILTGFGLKDSITGLVDKQYGNIMKYDLQVVFGSAVTDPKTDETRSWLSNTKEIKSIEYISAQSAKVISSKAPDTFSASLIVPESVADFADYANFHTRIGQKELPMTDDGVILTEKLAHLKNVGVGDKITLQGVDNKNVEVTVTGISENYIYHFIYMTPSLYEKLYGTSAPLNAAFAKLTDTSTGAINAFKDELATHSNIVGTNFVPLLKGDFGNIFTSLNYVIFVLILSAFALAMVVLYNLTNININERIREIATIKVLGFYDMEVSGYVFRENAIITVIGAVLGLGLGTLLHGFVVNTAEIDMIMFGRDIAPLSFLISFGLTILFSALVNAVMHFYLKKINMVESLKSVE